MAEREVFLYFQDGNDDAYCYPLSKFLGFRHKANGTVLMTFAPVETNDASEIDIVTLTIATNKEKDAITDVVNRINRGPHATGVITIADNVNQVYASTHITDVAGTIDT